MCGLEFCGLLSGLSSRKRVVVSRTCCKSVDVEEKLSTPSPNTSFVSIVVKELVLVEIVAVSDDIDFALIVVYFDDLVCVDVAVVDELVLVVVDDDVLVRVVAVVEVLARVVEVLIRVVIEVLVRVIVVVLERTILRCLRSYSFARPSLQPAYKYCGSTNIAQTSAF